MGHTTSSKERKQLAMKIKNKKYKKERKKEKKKFNHIDQIKR